MNNKKSILFCVSSLAGGGAEKLLIQIMKRFNYQEYDVYLYVFNYIGVYFDDIPSQVNWFTQKTEKGQLSKDFDIEIAFGYQIYWTTSITCDENCMGSFGFANRSLDKEILCKR